MVHAHRGGRAAGAGPDALRADARPNAMAARYSSISSFCQNT